MNALRIAPLLVLAGCIFPRPLFEVHAHDVGVLRRYGNETEDIELGHHRTITPDGWLELRRGGRHTPWIPTTALIVGEAGVCVSGEYPIAAQWISIDVDDVDPRIAPLVLPGADVRPVAVDERRWRVYGSGKALRAWVPDHLRRVQREMRRHIDLATPRYAVETAAARTRRTEAELLADAQGRSEARIGWTWREIDGVAYYALALDADARAEKVAYMHARLDVGLEEGKGFAPGPCPLTELGVPLFAGR